LRLVELLTKLSVLLFESVKLGKIIEKSVDGVSAEDGGTLEGSGDKVNCTS
jgi:hypothetical protein